MLIDRNTMLDERFRTRIEGLLRRPLTDEELAQQTSLSTLSDAVVRAIVASAPVLRAIYLRAVVASSRLTDVKRS